MSTHFGTTFDFGRKGMEVANRGERICIVAAEFINEDRDAECTAEVETVMSVRDARRVAVALLHAAEAAESDR